MVVINAQHETAVVIRRDGETVVFVRFTAGKLTCERATELGFRELWKESHHLALADTLDRFVAHGETHGITQEAAKGIEKLMARERNALSQLF